MALYTYIILENHIKSDLIIEVTDYLNKRWKCQGGISILQDVAYPSNFYFSQAMIKEIEEPYYAPLMMEG